MQTTSENQDAPPGSLDPVVRRRLIVDFFNLGPISRWDVCDKGRWLTESDLQLHKEAPDQELWALAFERAEQRGELDLMRKYVDAETPNSALSQGGPASKDNKSEPQPPLAPANG